MVALVLREVFLNTFKGLLLLFLLAGPGWADEVRSPRNQLYQFSARGPGEITAYLWIPEQCRQVRGVLVFAQNVPEGLIAGHPLIRKACAENDLAIVYTSTGFWPGRMEDFGNPNATHPEGIERLEALLNQLAASSGYAELARVPWLPIGESMSLLMVKGVLNARPERCIAGIFACDIAEPREKSVPTLGLQGTGSEWGQTNRELRTYWRETGHYPRACELRKKFPDWPATLVVDPCGGHFTCSDAMLGYMARYIDRIVKARLAADGSLRPLDVTAGYLARLPIAGATNTPIEFAANATDVARPWFPDRASAEEAQAMARSDWSAATQLPFVEAGENCAVHPWARNSVTTIDVQTAGEFSLKPLLLPKIPDGFAAAGETLATPSIAPRIEWVSGPIAPLGDNRFCVELDRTYKNANVVATLCLAVVAEASPGVRKSVQPLLLKFVENTAGTAQTIDFPPMADVSRTTKSIPLKATASSGLPVKFYVEAGPAVVEGRELRLTPLPPRTKFPVEVTVVAWQWGTCAPPLYAKAISRQTFRVLE